MIIIFFICSECFTLLTKTSLPKQKFHSGGRLHTSSVWDKTLYLWGLYLLLLMCN